MTAPINPVDSIPDDYIHTHRVLTITTGHEDGSASVRLWYLEVADTERLIAMLGPSQESSLIPPHTVETLVKINDGLPTLGSDFFS